MTSFISNTNTGAVLLYLSTHTRDNGLYSHIEEIYPVVGWKIMEEGDVLPVVHSLESNLAGAIVGSESRAVYYPDGGIVTQDEDTPIKLTPEEWFRNEKALHVYSLPKHYCEEDSNNNAVKYVECRHLVKSGLTFKLLDKNLVRGSNGQLYGVLQDGTKCAAPDGCDPTTIADLPISPAE